MSDGADVVRNDLCLIADVATAVCLAPLGADRVDPVTDREARELYAVAQRIREKLEIALDDGVQMDIAQLIRHIDDHRGEYRAAVLRWVDLLESIAFYVEERHGSGTGALKNSEVRGAVYYLLKGMELDASFPGVPVFLRPVVLELAVRGTIEFLVSLDNPVSSARPRLWAEAPRGGREKLFAKKQRVTARAKYKHWSEKLVAGLIRIILPPPFISGRVKADVDKILQSWAEQSRHDNLTPGQRIIRPFMATALWIGNHPEQVRAAIDAIALAVYETRRLSEFDRHEQMEIVKQAVVMVFEDLGFRGVLGRTIVRFVVDLLADATDDLYAKRLPA